MFDLFGMFWVDVELWLCVLGWIGMFDKGVDVDVGGF